MIACVAIYENMYVSILKRSDASDCWNNVLDFTGITLKRFSLVVESIIMQTRIASTANVNRF